MSGVRSESSPAYDWLNPTQNRYFSRVGVRDLIKMIRLAFGQANSWGYPVIPNIVHGVGNQGHWTDPEGTGIAQPADVSLGNCGAGATAHG